MFKLYCIPNMCTLNDVLINEQKKIININKQVPTYILIIIYNKKH